MRSWAGILTELGVAQHGHILDPLHRCRMEIGGEALVAKHRQPLLERQLKPVATGDPVATPIVEVLMGNDAFNPLKLAIGCRCGIRQNQLRIEDVQAFVLHGAHVEVTHGNDVVFLQVVLEAIDLFIPGHRPFQ